MRVADFLSSSSVHHETMIHPPVFTAQRRAHLLHISGRRVMKAVLLATETEKVLAILPAPDHVDLEAIAAHLLTSVRLATDDEIAATFVDCERGVLVPFGRLYGMKTILEASIDSDTWIVFEGERHFITIRMRCRDFELLEQPTRIAFATN